MFYIASFKVYTGEGAECIASHHLSLGVQITPETVAYERREHYFIYSEVESDKIEEAIALEVVNELLHNKTKGAGSWETIEFVAQKEQPAFENVKPTESWSNDAKIWILKEEVI